MFTKKTVSVLCSILLSFALPLTVLIGSAAFPTSVRAFSVTITVNSNSDEAISGNGFCTLREAIVNANTNTGIYSDCAHGLGNEIIVFSDALGTATITLGSDLPDIIDILGLTINGGGDITVSGNNLYRVFVNSGTPLILDSLWVKDGRAVASNGGGIYNDGGALTITNSLFSGNFADLAGGGIYNYGTLTITNSLFYYNSAGDFGGGVHNLGPMTITNSIFTTNSADIVGGGVNNNGTLTITKSTFYNNQADFDGGGVYNYVGNTLAIANSTFTLNDAGENGGGVFNYSGGTLTITNSTFSSNTSANGAAVFNHSGGTLNLFNTILANSIGSGDCVNSLGTVSGNNNLIEGTGVSACGLANGTNGNITGSDPNLGTLVGSPAYFRLNSGSPAIDAGNDTKCAAAPVNNTSQNGITRPYDVHCDIGSVESGTTFVVNVTEDTDDGFCEPFLINSTNCTLREAINAANTHSGADTVHFDDSLGTATITLSSTLPAISGSADLIIDGDDEITISGNNLYRVLVVNPNAKLTLENLEVKNGKVISNLGAGVFNASGILTIINCAFSGNTVVGGDGGGVYNSSGGTLTITDSIFSGNTAALSVFGGSGGAVYNNAGTLSITRTIFSGNSASFNGGALYSNLGTTTITDSTFTNNSASGQSDGGAIYSAQGTVTIIHSTFSANHSNNGSGGGIYNFMGTLTITRSTFSGNSVPSGAGGGIINYGTLNVANSTFTNNSAQMFGGGVYNSAGGVMTSTNNTFSANSTGFADVGGSGIYNQETLNLYNTILANNFSGGDCQNSGGTVTGSNNLIEATSSGACGLTNGVNGNIIGSDPNLGPATLINPVYFPLNAGSLALNAGNDAKCAAAPVNNTSQNGVPRPQDTHCEIGSYEQNMATNITISGNSGVAGATLSYVYGTTLQTVTADGSGNYVLIVPYNWSGTVTPSLAANAFCPASQAYSNLTTSQTIQNYAHEACPQFGSNSLWTSAFDLSHGWTVSDYVRTVGDVNGDGRADLVGFGLDGVYVVLSTGTGFGAISKWTSAFDLAHGWTVSQFVRTVGDVNNDGKADLVGFGQDGVYVALSTGSSFGGISKWTSAFDLAHGWTVSDYVRTVGDVNGDGRADIVGFGQDGVYVGLSTGSSFSTMSKWVSAFDLAHGWTVSQYVRTVGDVNGDGMDDLVGFGQDGVYVALSTGSSFSVMSKWVSAFDLSHGWTVSQYVRTVGDVNGDGKADVVGFGSDGVYVALSLGNSFALPSRSTTSFDLSHGWTVSQHVRTVGDVNGGGKADLVGFGQDGVYVALVQ